MINKSITFDHIGNGTVNYTTAFEAMFPQLTKLLKQASIVEFSLNANQRFRQYIWTNDEGMTSGWLCKLEHCIPQGRNLIDEHIELANTVGGIVDHWLANGADNPKTFIDTNLFTFSLTDSRVGIGEWKKSTKEILALGEAESLDPSKFVTFAREANGNATCYDCQTKEVFVYLHDDYSAFATTPAGNSAQCMLYRYNDAVDFVDYTELLAKQWLDILDIKK